MSERRGYRVFIKAREADGSETAVAQDLRRYDEESQGYIVAALLELAKNPLANSRRSAGYQRFEFSIVLSGGDAVHHFVCPFQFLPDEERIEIRRIFELPAS